eukprot:448051-Prymnesium_polylepis.1
MGVEQGVACGIADDGCGHSPCSHAGEEAVYLVAWASNVVLLAASLMMAAAVLRAFKMVRR